MLQIHKSSFRLGHSGLQPVISLSISILISRTFRPWVGIMAPLQAFTGVSLMELWLDKASGTGIQSFLQVEHLDRGVNRGQILSSQHEKRQNRLLPFLFFIFFNLRRCSQFSCHFKKFKRKYAEIKMLYSWFSLMEREHFLPQLCNT